MRPKINNDSNNKKKKKKKNNNNSYNSQRTAIDFFDNEKSKRIKFEQWKATMIPKFQQEWYLQETSNVISSLQNKQQQKQQEHHHHQQQQKQQCHHHHQQQDCNNQGRIGQNQEKKEENVDIDKEEFDVDNRIPKIDTRVYYHGIISSNTNTNNSNNNNKTSSCQQQQEGKHERKLPNGIFYMKEFLSKNEEEHLVSNIIDRNDWSTVIARRQQFYGDIYYHTKHDVPAIQPILQKGTSFSSTTLSSNVVDPTSETSSSLSLSYQPPPPSPPSMELDEMDFIIQKLHSINPHVPESNDGYFLYRNKLMYYHPNPMGVFTAVKSTSPQIILNNISTSTCSSSCCSSSWTATSACTHATTTTTTITTKETVPVNTPTTICTCVDRINTAIMSHATCKVSITDTTKSYNSNHNGHHNYCINNTDPKITNDTNHVELAEIEKQEQQQQQLQQDDTCNAIEVPTQVLVNEYRSTIGIHGHIDDPFAFGQVLVMISLNDPIIMKLERTKESSVTLATKTTCTCNNNNNNNNNNTDNINCNVVSREYHHNTYNNNNNQIDVNNDDDYYDEIHVLLEPRSLLILKGQARFEYEHAITRYKWMVINHKISRVQMTNNNNNDHDDNDDFIQCLKDKLTMDDWDDMLVTCANTNKQKKIENDPVDDTDNNDGQHQNRLSIHDYNIKNKSNVNNCHHQDCSNTNRCSFDGRSSSNSNENCSINFYRLTLPLQNRQANNDIHNSNSSINNCTVVSKNVHEEQQQQQQQIERDLFIYERDDVNYRRVSLTVRHLLDGRKRVAVAREYDPTVMVSLSE